MSDSWVDWMKLMVTSLRNHHKSKDISDFSLLSLSNGLCWKKLFSYRFSKKMVGDIPNSDISEKKKHKKHKKDRKERTEIVLPQTLPKLQTTPAFTPNELLTEMGFDVSPNTSISSHSTTSPTTITVMDEKNMISIYVYFTTATWNCFRPSLTQNDT